VACRKNRLVDIEHTANEAMARAYAVSGDTNKAKKYIETARRQLDGLDLSKEDRRVYSDQIRQTARLIEGR
jgi:predicted Zn-dependent protease